MAFTQFHARRRRGTAVVLVMLMVSVTLATAYALVWSQGGSLQIQQNANSRARARQAALTGLSIALREMREEDRWIGADATSSERPLSATESFQIEYATGDAALDPSDPRWPYRVTVTATGHSTAAHNGGKAEHKTRAVVQLVPRKLNPPPKDWEAVWSEINSSDGPTVYQYDQGDIDINPPAQIRGPARLLGELRLGKNYEWDDAARYRYFTDLVKMKAAGWSDYRPFTDPPALPEQEQDDSEEAFLQEMGVELRHQKAGLSVGGKTPSAVQSYRLYPGGRLYEVPSLNELDELETHPEANPLRIFYCADNFHPRDGFQLQGTLVSDGDLYLDGRDIELKPFQLPLGLAGTDEPVELPTLIAGDDIRVEDDARANVTGMIVAWDALRIEGGAGFELRGRAVWRELELEGGADWWEENYWFWLYWFFRHPDPDMSADDPRVLYFPVYLKDILDPAPKVVLGPRGAAVRRPWPADGEAVYVPHPDDDGLRWEVIRWQDGVE